MDPRAFRQDPQPSEAPYAVRLRRALTRHKRDGLPFDEAWDETLREQKPPRDWRVAIADHEHPTIREIWQAGYDDTDDYRIKLNESMALAA